MAERSGVTTREGYKTKKRRKRKARGCWVKGSTAGSWGGRAAQDSSTALTEYQKPDYHFRVQEPALSFPLNAENYQVGDLSTGITGC